MNTGIIYFTGRMLFVAITKLNFKEEDWGLFVFFFFWQNLTVTIREIGTKIYSIPTGLTSNRISEKTFNELCQFIE